MCSRHPSMQENAHFQELQATPKTRTKPSNIKSLYVSISKKKKKQQFSNFFPLFEKGGKKKSNIGHGFLLLFCYMEST